MRLLSYYKKNLDADMCVLREHEYDDSEKEIIYKPREASGECNTVNILILDPPASRTVWKLTSVFEVSQSVAVCCDSHRKQDSTMPYCMRIITKAICHYK